MTTTRTIGQSTGLAAAVAASGQGARWLAASFTTSVPLDGAKVMPAQTITGALAFTPGASPQAGASCYVRLTADGAHAPTFAGFTEHGSSAGFVNTAGQVNLVTFWHDGTGAFYAVAQPVAAIAAATPASAAIASETPTTLTVTFTVPLDGGFVPAASAFAITNTGGTDTVTAVAVSGGNLVLTKSRTTLGGDTVTLAYTRPGTAPLTDTNGNPVGSFSGRAVTNNVSSGVSNTYVQLASVTNLTQTTDSAGYDYTETTDSGGYQAPIGKGIAATHLPSGADGYAGCAVGSGGTSYGPIVALCSTASPASYTDSLLWIAAGAPFQSGNYLVGAGSGAVTPATVAIAAGDIPRIRRSSTSLIAEVSKDGGSTWTNLYTLTGQTTAQLTAFWQTGAAGTGNAIKKPFVSSTFA